MSQPRALPRRVAVVGDGPLGLLAACALRQALPLSEVTVVATAPDPLALAERIGSGLGFTNRLHDRLGVEEDLLIRHAGASHRLVMRYAGWGGAGQQGCAPYGAAIDPRLRTAFAREWGGGPRNAATGAPVGSVGEALADDGRFLRPDGRADSPLADVDYGLRWNVPAYRDLLLALAQRLGVRQASGAVSGIRPDGQGGVAALLLAGEPLAADLFLDCTGPQAALLAQLPGYARIDRGDALRLAVRQEPGVRVTLADRAVLTPAGWLQELAGRDGMLSLLGRAPAAGEAELVAALGGEPQGELTLKPGRAAESWLGNVVALGDAAAHGEPLGFFQLDLAHRQLELLLELLPGRSVDPRERAEFNRRAALMADRVADVIAGHYAAPAAQALFGAREVSPELALALDQFARRGRVPFFEEMPFLPQEWAAQLQALGLPQGLGALARAEGDEAGRQMAERHARQCEAALRAAPPYPAWLQQVLQG